jgi:hypothetical protein
VIGEKVRGTKHEAAKERTVGNIKGLHDDVKGSMSFVPKNGCDK